jgi:hypothetical protein
MGKPLSTKKTNPTSWSPTDGIRLYPIDTYKESTPDNSPWEGVFKGETAPVFPHDIARFYKEDHDNIRSSPFGNTLTLDFAKAAIEGYSLGQRDATDFLTINCASTDYVGHKYGPNSIEEEDVFLRLDKDLAAFFSYLDTKVGKGNYLVFLTADHGASHSDRFYERPINYPAGFVGIRDLIEKGLGDTLNTIFGVKRPAAQQLELLCQLQPGKSKTASTGRSLDSMKKNGNLLASATISPAICGGYE